MGKFTKFQDAYKDSTNMAQLVGNCKTQNINNNSGNFFINERCWKQSYASKIGCCYFTEKIDLLASK